MTSRRTAILHRGARPQPREMPDWLVDVGGTVGWPSNGAVSNVALTPHAKIDAAARAGGLRPGRRPPPGARGLLGHAGVLPRADGRDLPHVLGGPDPARAGGVRRLAAADEQARGADRGQRRRRLDRPPLLRRRVPRDPQRRDAAGPDARPAPPRVRRAAAHRLRRPGGGAQGPAGPAAGVRGPARRRPRHAHRRRASATTSSRRCWSTARASPPSAACPTTRATRRCSTPTCSSPRRWAASRSGWC